MSKSFRTKKNLNLELENTNDNLNNQIKSSKVVNLNEKEEFGQSIEFGYDSVIFKEDNFSVGSKGIKQLNTGIIISVVDPKDFILGKKLGIGASGTVHLAVYKPNGVTVAIKAINIYDKAKRKQFKNDLKVLWENNCPFLVKFHGAFFEEGSVKLVLEYMDLGSLDKVISKIKNEPRYRPSEAVLSKITQQILQGLLYLHKIKHQIHRDMKPANILVNSEGFVKLTDFGITKTLENTTEFCTTFVGTKNYMSPERILGNEYSFSSDIWSLGLIVYELATGTFPYNFSKVFIEHVDCILKEPEPTLPSDKGYSNELQNFVTRCLKKNPDERDSVAELCAHPWILKYSDRDSNLEFWLAHLFEFLIIE